MKFFCLILAAILVSRASSLSFQGQDDLKSNLIIADEEPEKPSEDVKFELASQREEMRKMRLYLLGALTEQLVAWFFQDIIPKEVIQRTKRSLNVPDESDMSYLTDAAVTALGAIMDREECRKMMVCGACNVVKKLVPGSQVAVVVADHYLPPSMKTWDKYTVAKRAFINDKDEHCEEIYHCRLDEAQTNEI